MAGEDADLLLARQLQAEEEYAFRQQQQQQSGPDRDVAQQQHFQARLASGIATFQQYDDPVLQAQALSTLPEELLRQTGCPPAQHDVLARALLAWFKQEFFTWVNKPDCEHCGSSETSAVGTSRPATAEERDGQAHVVEVYSCGACGRTTRFPRYNAPGKLLQTRRGRCGEWANAFTLVCLAAGLEARYVMDWTDHVWTEFWSAAQGRWIHLDPCEQAFDQPHLYEGGWGKQLSYVVAFGRGSVADVSRRYSTDAAATEGRQQQVADPGWVARACQAATAQLRAGCSPEAVAQWEAWDAAEAQELQAGQPQPPDADLPGRQTGSVAWRAARGELGNQHSAALEVQPAPETQPAPEAQPAPEQQPAPEALVEATAPQQAAGGSSSMAAVDRDEFTARMHAAFSRLMRAGGVAPNEAALAALQSVREEMRLGWPPSEGQA